MSPQLNLTLSSPSKHTIAHFFTLASIPIHFISLANSSTSFCMLSVPQANVAISSANAIIAFADIPNWATFSHCSTFFSNPSMKQQKKVGDAVQPCATPASVRNVSLLRILPILILFHVFSFM